MRAVLVVAALIVGILECISFAMDGWQKDYEAANIFYEGSSLLQTGKPFPGDGRPPQQIPFPDIADWNSLVMRLKYNGGCLLVCPTYTIEIHGDGAVVYEGEAGVLITGKHSTQIDQGDVKALYQDFRDAAFFHLYDEYWDGSVDGGSQTTTIVFDDHKKAVLNSGGPRVNMPAVVGALEERIDTIGRSKIWATGDASTVSALRAEGWDFTNGNPRNAEILAASGEGDAAFVRDLMDAGIDPREFETEGCTAASVAIRNGKADNLSLLLDHGAKTYVAPVCNLLSDAAYEGSAPMLAAVQKHLPQRDKKRAMDDALLSAAAGTSSQERDLARYDDVVRTLLKAGADVNARDNRGNNALHFADYKPEVVKILLKAGARGINERNSNGETPLLASWDEKVTLLLLKAGADPYAKMPSGAMALDIAEARDQKERIEVLKIWMAAHPPKTPRTKASLP